MNLNHKTLPCCDSDTQRSDMNHTLNEYPLITLMLSDDNMKAAWKHFKANKGAPFSSHSYGYRTGKSAHQAVTHVQDCISQGYKTAVDIDLSKFFDEVNHDMLMNRVGRKIKDKALMQLLGRFLRAGIAETETGLWFSSDKSMPQGGPLSPLLSNIILDEQDKKLTRERLHFARYADDIMILVKSKFIGNKVKVAISHYISKRLKLIVN